AIVGWSDGSLGYWSNQGTTARPLYMETPEVLNGLGVGSLASPAVLDVDGDGDFDLLVGNQDGVFATFINTGSSTNPSFMASAGSNPFLGIDVGYQASPSIGDLDGDGDLDAVVGFRDSTGGGGMAFFENTGPSLPSFVQRTGTANPFEGVPNRVYSPSLRDVDADGDLDVVAGYSRGLLLLFENTGDASMPSFSEQTLSPFLGYDAGQWIHESLGDLDGDGDLDLAIGTFDGTVMFWENTGNSGQPAFRVAAANPFDGIDVGERSAPAFADLNADGDLDVIVAPRYGDFAYLENIGGPTSPVFVERFGSENPFDNLGFGSYGRPAAVDLDADGDIDVVSGEKYGRLLWIENTGTAFSPAFHLTSTAEGPFAGIDLGSATDPALWDFDGDGDLDVLSGEDYGPMHLLRNTGTPSNPAFVVDANPWDELDTGRTTSPALADLDGDGDIDVLVGEASGYITYFRSSTPLFSDGFEIGDLSAWSATSTD
ncbi:MAG: VCBS repeat-containing protein, partial [Thermoanaerobaculia bacterium]|nr:VCBS repeat-containing protein [Thermoanaerobaculia bacterium]